MRRTLRTKLICVFTVLVLVVGLIPGAVFAGPFIAEDASEDAVIAEETGKDAVILEDAGKDTVIAEETGGDHAAASDTDEEAAADDIREYPMTDSDPAEQSHIHDDVTYMKWTATDSLPASGSYYLEDDVRITRVFYRLRQARPLPEWI